jgi:hypothetical protein
MNKKILTIFLIGMFLLMSITTLPAYGLNTNESTVTMDTDSNHISRVYGTVTDQYGEPLENVRVILRVMFNPYPWPHRTRTDSNGFYEFNYVFYGMYEIFFIKDLVWRGGLYLIEIYSPEVEINYTLNIGVNVAALETQALQYYSSQQEVTQSSQSL